MNRYVLKYNEEAPLGDDFEFSVKRGEVTTNSWEKLSLPLGNGFFGASVFGRTEVERVQITENSLCNPYMKTDDPNREQGGLMSFVEILLEFGHKKVEGYERGLVLDNAVSYVHYEYQGVRFQREYFLSYPSKVLCIKVTADKPTALSFNVRFFDPFANMDFCHVSGDNGGKHSHVYSRNQRLHIRGTADYYQILYEGILSVDTDGEKSVGSDVITVNNASYAYIYFSCGTNYKCESRVFLEKDRLQKLTPYKDPHDKVYKRIKRAETKGYGELFYRHVTDYKRLFDRCLLSFGVSDDRFTDEILSDYKQGKTNLYLENLLFAYGRYLLIASSRKGGLPANLQGIWSAYYSSPWASDYHHNVNVQMNYWHAFPSNLHECFSAYAEYAKAYMEDEKGAADEYMINFFPDRYEGRGNNGLLISTGGFPYYMGHEIASPNQHSGPGNGGLTALLLWDYYMFTNDMKFLREVGFPFFYELSKAYLKCLIERDGKYLVKISASPEQEHNGKYYQSSGCAFDQQMVFATFDAVIQSADILNYNDAIITAVRDIKDKLEPVIIGADGQIKEFREETHYGDIGEKQHRHISHLMGLYPGNIITKDNKEWIEGAKYTLYQRGNKSTGWAVAHRICLWARTGCGDKAHEMIKSLIMHNIAPNLWDIHPPFQIDGNFGYCAGVCEMLLQSHEGCVELLPALPSDWKNGSVSGLIARGNTNVDVQWKNGVIEKAELTKQTGGELVLKYCRLEEYDYSIPFERIDSTTIKFNLNKNARVKMQRKVLKNEG